MRIINHKINVALSRSRARANSIGPVRLIRPPIICKRVGFYILFSCKQKYHTLRDTRPGPSLSIKGRYTSCYIRLIYTKIRVTVAIASCSYFVRYTIIDQRIPITRIRIYCMILLQNRKYKFFSKSTFILYTF